MSAFEKLLVVIFSGAIIAIGLQPLKNSFPGYTKNIIVFWNSLSKNDLKGEKNRENSNIGSGEFGLGGLFSNLKEKIFSSLNSETKPQVLNQKELLNKSTERDPKHSDESVIKSGKKMDKVTSKDREELDNLVNGL